MGRRSLEKLVLEKAGNYKFEYISRYINLNKLISTLRGNVYIVANP